MSILLTFKPPSHAPVLILGQSFHGSGMTVSYKAYLSALISGIPSTASAIGPGRTRDSGCHCAQTCSWEWKAYQDWSPWGCLYWNLKPRCLFLPEHMPCLVIRIWISETYPLQGCRQAHVQWLTALVILQRLIAKAKLQSILYIIGLIMPPTELCTRETVIRMMP